MYEKTSKLLARKSQKNISKSKAPEHAQGFVALKDCDSKKFYLHELLDDSSTWKGSDDGAKELVQRSTDGRTMTRKFRSRQPRIHTAVLQSGYCAICHLHYISLEEHIHSKKHLKLIGNDANFISLNGFLDQDTSLGTFLDFNDITIGLNEKLLVDCDYPPKVKRSRPSNKMPRTRAASLSRKVKQASQSPTRSESGHHLRSRKQINYASPVTEDDSLPEMPEKEVHRRTKRHNNCVNSIVEEDSLTELPERDNRELRSSSRLLAKLIDHENEEVWNSGRPKRTCNRPKRVSADERLVADNRSYYKVEVLSSKLRSSGNNPKESEVSRKRSRSPPNLEPKPEEKGLIVKFKKLRNSELIQLNNEAENFLFPKKDDDSSSSDEEVDEDTNTTVSTEKNDSSSVVSEFDDPKSPKFKTEDEASMDSTCSSETKQKKKRRTHAEAFIMDNQKYYKFETPGSRLRYQGSFMPPIIKIKSPKHNGDCSVKMEKQEVIETEKAEEKPFRINLNDYEFSFEKPPKNETWYQTFERQDRAEERYTYFNDEAFWNPFILPYQMGPLPPIDPKKCISEYSQVKRYFLDPPSSSTSGGTTPDPNATTSAACHSEVEDEDDKLNIASGEEMTDQKKKVSKEAAGKNPRKSPRQHASTLAILSSLIHQRKRKSKNIDSKIALSPIPEEQAVLSPIPEEGEQSKQAEGKDEHLEEMTKVDDHPEAVEQGNKTENDPSICQEANSGPSKLPPKSTGRKPGRRPKIDYKAIVRTINEELTNSFDPALEDIQIEDVEDEVLVNGKTNVLEVLQTYEGIKLSEDLKGTRRFLNGASGKKPGRKKRTNKTGWPNRIRRLMRKDQQTKDDPDDSTIDSVSVNADSEDIDFCDDTNSTDSIKKKSNVDTVINSVKDNSRENENVLNDVGTNNSSRNGVKSANVQNESVVNVLENTASSNNNNKSVSKSLKMLQPYVRVQKLNRDQIDNKLPKVQCGGSPKRTNKLRRRMPASPRSPRMLRKPRGRWYKER